MTERMCLMVILCVLAGDVTGYLDQPDAVLRAKRMAPELFRTAPEMIAMAGYQVETHVVQTEDGYLITLHHLPPRTAPLPKEPVLIMHGLALQTDYWIAQGPNHSLPYLLADRGYDVWIGNVRGNIYSEAHISMDPSRDQFWKFSWHEIGLYDLPALIDFILTRTGHDRLLYVGHSMGISTACVLLSSRPEYNGRITVMVGLAPAVYGYHSRSRVVRDMLVVGNRLQSELEKMDRLRFLPYTESRVAFAYFLCRDGSLGQEFCEQLLFQIAGYSTGTNKTMLPLYISRLAGASLYTVMHFLQLVKSGKFEQRDLGPEKNLKVYNSTQPPEYDLSKVVVPLEVFTSTGDALVPSEDVELLRYMLPNIISIRRVSAENFNHLDFLIHMNVKELLNDHILATLDKY